MTFTKHDVLNSRRTGQAKLMKNYPLPVTKKQLKEKKEAQTNYKKLRK